MKTRLISIVLGSMFLTIAYSPTAISAPAPYSFKLDSVLVEGQLDFIENFDGNFLSSAWEITEGTVAVSNGFATLKNPGTIFTDTIGSAKVIQEDTFFRSTFSIMDGNGDFVATTTWQEGIPGADRLYTTEITDRTAANNTQSIGLGVANFSPTLAALLGGPAGPTIFFSKRTDLEAGGSEISLDFASINIGITGPIELRVAF
ncbi:MAG: hypothetical protein U5S82_03585 [Gammaproteobacteria bacterium]|nr:hypothetical protein [Gammaproteobacteria bacterium]